MAAFIPKNYQSAVLDSVESYFHACRELSNANTAFYQTTLELWGQGSQYSPIEGFATDMPYFCLRVPTGGGKTWLAAKAVLPINTRLLGVEHSVILWPMLWPAEVSYKRLQIASAVRVRLIYGLLC